MATEAPVPAIKTNGLDELNAGSIVEPAMANGDKPKVKKVVNLGPTKHKEGCDPQPPAGEPLWKIDPIG